MTAAIVTVAQKQLRILTVLELLPRATATTEFILTIIFKIAGKVPCIKHLLFIFIITVTLE